MEYQNYRKGDKGRDSSYGTAETEENSDTDAEESEETEKESVTGKGVVDVQVGAGTKEEKSADKTEKGK